MQQGRDQGTIEDKLPATRGYVDRVAKKLNEEICRHSCYVYDKLQETAKQLVERIEQEVRALQQMINDRELGHLAQFHDKEIWEMSAHGGRKVRKKGRKSRRN